MYGGLSGCGQMSDGCGTVFAVTLGGNETVLHTFQGGADGATPTDSLISRKQMLYGTTGMGGDATKCPYKAIGGCGVAFAMPLSGQLFVTHSFTGHGDGFTPSGTLASIGKTIYGTTEDGGFGSVYAMTGKNVHTIFSFSKSGAQGEDPVSGVIVSNHVLYGAARVGGQKKNGTIFSLTTAGVETTLYKFRGGSDGSKPASALTNVNGVFYGVTTYGGIVTTAPGFGTVYSVTANGVETVLHRFGAVSGDGAFPKGTLLNVGGTLYGTTGSGGQFGWGTIFKIALDGTETVLYSFGAQPDAESPAAGLIDVAGTLYGTSTGGGTADKGAVFSFTP
jgi:uncharacterized repeat protein (TIGR03803 family)